MLHHIHRLELPYGWLEMESPCFLICSYFTLQKDGEYLSGHDMFLKHVATAFHIFVESTEKNCLEK